MISHQPRLTSSESSYYGEVLDIAAADGNFRPIYRYPKDQRRHVRQAYVDIATRELNAAIEIRNRPIVSKSDRWKKQWVLKPGLVAQIIAVAENTARLRTDPRISASHSALAFYDPDQGIYNFDTNYQMSVIMDYMPIADGRYLNSILTVLNAISPDRIANQKPYLVNFQNGVLDTKHGRLLPHAPEHFFTTSMAVNYNPNAENPHFTDSEGLDWDIESWIADLSDDPSVTDVLWEVAAACMRPGERWDKSPWLYSTTGANGKGTFCELIRAVVGPQYTASLNVADFANDFMLSQLMNTTCVLADENPVGTFIDKSDTYKAAVTSDMFTINRKYRDPVSMTYPGLILQCMNAMPQVKDRTGSFYRRQLFIPMEKSFVGRDKPEIKRDFIPTREVAEYVAKRCMDMRFRSFSNPARCSAVLDEYKEYNDIVREFVNDVWEEFPWDFIPIKLAVDLYHSWCDRNYPGQQHLGRAKIVAEIKRVLRERGGWLVPFDGSRTDTAKFDFSEPCELLYEYQMERWTNRTNSSDPKQIMLAYTTLNRTRVGVRVAGFVRDDSTPLHPSAQVVAYDPDNVEFRPADQLIETNANLRRDYGLDDDNKVSDRVAAQLAANPHSADVVCDLTFDDVVPLSIAEARARAAVSSLTPIRSLADIEADFDPKTQNLYETVRTLTDSVTNVEQRELLMQAFAHIGLDAMPDPALNASDLPDDTTTLLE